MNDFNRRSFTQLLLSGVAVGALGAALPAAAQDQPVTGGTLNFLIQPEPPTLVTIAHTAGPTTRISGKITEGLLAYDLDSFAPIPQLAESWQVAPDGLQYQFNLRKNVRWHDGRDFTSADVAYSILTLKEVHPRGRATFSSVTGVETPDDHTAIIKLSAPAPFLLGALSSSESPIVPKHVYEGTDVPGNPNGKAPIGTGPFKFKEWIVGSHVILERNEDYWDEGKPYIDRIVVRFIPDPAARLAAFESKEVDLAGDTPVPLSQLEHLRTIEHLEIEKRGGEYSPTVYRIEFNLASKYYGDVRVRRAVAHAVDREAIINLAFYGYGIATNTPVSPLLKKFHNPNVPNYEFDTAKSEALLDEAGFPRGAEGWRFEVDHDVMPYGSPHTQIGEYLRDALAKVGIKINLRAQDVPTWLKRVYTDRDFDSQSGAMGNTFDPTIGIQRLFWSKNFKKGVPFSNGSGYNNPEVDALLEAAAVENDEAKRIKLFNRFQEIVTTDLPEITLVTGIPLTIYNTKVHNHTATADGVSGSFSNLFIKA